MQILDDEGNIVERGTEGNIGIHCKPKRPVGLFAGYLVGIFGIFLSYFEFKKKVSSIVKKKHIKVRNIIAFIM